MAPVNTDNSNDNEDATRQLLRAAIAHLEHVLPGQAPIRDFVHHNTLHGYQHLDFTQALAAARETTGARAWLPEDCFRKFFREGRIDETDLDAALKADASLDSDRLVASTGSGTAQRRLLRGDIYRAALLHPLQPVTGGQLGWQIEEMDALHRFQADVCSDARRQLLERAQENTEAEAIQALWFACLQALDLQHYLLHPEELVDLDPERAEEILHDFNVETGAASATEPATLHRRVHREARNLLGQLIRQVGNKHTLRSLLKSMTGEDILDDIRPLLLRHVSNYLDQGLSAWRSHEPGHGFFRAWRDSAASELNWVFDDLPEWHDNLQSLPDNALDTIIAELSRLGLAESHWPRYLEKLALELPGWSGMFLWRHLHPGYDNIETPVDITDYLAVRLVLDRLYAQRLCRQQWQLEANLDVLRWYFRRRRSEFYCRYQLFNTRLPEYLVMLVQKQLLRTPGLVAEYQPWKHISDMIMAWKQSPMSDEAHGGYHVFTHGWQLFRLAQHLGLCANDIAALGAEQLASIFGCLDKLDEDTRGFIWLQAYERHYRDELFHAVASNRGRGRWTSREQRPEAQVVFCMDDREEGIRRHLEEQNPMVETLGAAGFFGVAINWKGLDDEHVTPLCPVVVTPAHELRELPRKADEGRLGTHRRRLAIRHWLRRLLFQETARSTFAPLLIALAAPLALLALLGKSLAGRHAGLFSNRLRKRFDHPVATRVDINASDSAGTATAEHPRIGFSEDEQVERVRNFLRSVGLTRGFAHFVVMMGHGSSSSNNPHLAAYDCGACSGRHGGPNARVFATLANRSVIRARLREEGIDIPDDTRFLGAEHDTCDESIHWYDIDLLPESHVAAFEKLAADLQQAAKRSAHERCRRLASAPRRPTLNKALRHIVGRAHDISQARPELGHATNAAAFIGRRALSQGAFFDRRVFLISYDASVDDEAGHILEAILLAAGPVGAGINLEYYFSTVNNDDYGSGSKVTHNIAGLFGVMDGTSGDLRTGLPLQMIEIHEAMRLQVLVEASTGVLTDIYKRQPSLQELIGNGWLLLSAIDPDSGQISVFEPATGFKPWRAENRDLPEVDNSTQWYDGHDRPLPPALIKQPVSHA